MSLISHTHHKRRVAILGATGSIGTSAIDVCQHLAGEFEIHSLTAATSWQKLAELALKTRPKFIAINDHSHIAALRDADIQYSAA